VKLHVSNPQEQRMAEPNQPKHHAVQGDFDQNLTIHRPTGSEHDESYSSSTALVDSHGPKSASGISRPQQESAPPLNEDSNDTGAMPALPAGAVATSSPTATEKEDAKNASPTASAAAVAMTRSAATGASVNSSNSGGASVTFAMPAVVAFVEPINHSIVRGDEGIVCRTALASTGGARSSTIHSSSKRLNASSGSASSGSLSSEGGNGDGDAVNGNILLTRGGSATGSSLSFSSGEMNSGSKKSKSNYASGKNVGAKLNLKRSLNESKKCEELSQIGNNINSDPSISNSATMESGCNSTARVTNTSGSGSNSGTNSRSCSNSGSGSGSDGNEGASSSNPAMVTATTNTNTTSSGSGDDRSSSGSGGGSGSNVRRSEGDASADYYYAGYNSGSIEGASSNGATIYTRDGATGAFVQAPSVDPVTGMLSFSSFRSGGPPAAANGVVGFPPHHHQNSAARHPNHGREAGTRQGQGPAIAPGIARHIVVATDDTSSGGLPPPPPAYASHLRHHSRHYHQHRNRRNAGNEAINNVNNRAAGATIFSPQGGGASHGPVAPRNRIPSAIEAFQLPQSVPRQQNSTPIHRLRLPPTDEQGILQRVPQAHATVVASDMPPPPTSSDAWSSTSIGSSSRNTRMYVRGAGKKAVLATTTAAGLMKTGEQSGISPKTSGNFKPSCNSPNLNSSDSSTVSIGESISRLPKAAALHATTEDHVRKPSMYSPTKKVVLKQSQVLETAEETVDSKPTTVKSSKMGAKSNNCSGLKRKMTAMSRGGVTSDYSSDSAKSETEAVGSGSDGGYAASSSSNDVFGGAESQSGSGSSASDSVSSEDGKKAKVSATRTASASDPSKNKKAGVSLDLQTHSKRTETSSMSSTVLADFSSVVNEEEGSLVLNSFNGSLSPRSSDTSLSSTGANEMENVHKAKSVAQPEVLAKSADSEPVLETLSTQVSGRKRDSSQQVAYHSATSRKRSKSSCNEIHASKLLPSESIQGAATSAGASTLNSGLSIMEKTLQQKARAAHHHHYRGRSTGRKMLEESFLSAKRLAAASEPEDNSLASDHSRATLVDGKVSVATSTSFKSPFASAAVFKPGVVTFEDGVKPAKKNVFHDSVIYSLGTDVMAQIMSFLEPPEVHSFLTTPFSKSWLETYTNPQELWKVLCSSKPFYAKLDESDYGSSDASTSSYPLCNDLERYHLVGQFRLLFTSFVKCMKYLERIKDDALNGRTPSAYNNGNQNEIYPFNRNGSLKAYFKRARKIERRHRQGGTGSSSSSSSGNASPAEGFFNAVETLEVQNGRGEGNNNETSQEQPNPSGPRIGHSMLTQRLLMPTRAGEVDHVNLPWSCAIYAVVNWMVAFTDVEGIQIMCLKVLPYLLEDESQRTTAQWAGLTDGVLRAMVLFPDSIEVHTVAFHTLVLLARPLGGNEGMLFHRAMVNTRGIFNVGSSSSKNGIVIMLDSMRRFAQDEVLQAMSCWSLVNVALTPLQKTMLVKLGGLTVTANAMLQHPYNAEVQFRALFALINLVIPSEARPEETEEMRQIERELFQELGEVGETSEKEMLDASVGQIANLVVVAMKNFCSSEAILNRACLVLHNLSLNEDYHSVLLWTPNCYQMLEWCIGNYPHDHVLQQSAGGTIQRLNETLSSDDDLRDRFNHSIRAQQQHSLDVAWRDALYLEERQQELAQRQMNQS